MAKFRILFVSQLLIIRSTLPLFIFFQTVMPVAFVFAMGHYTGVRLGSDQLYRIVAGTITFNLAFQGLSSMALRVSYMRQSGLLLHYSSLPLQKLTFISAILSARVVLLLPGIVAPILAGMWLYNLDIQLSLWLLVVMVLGTFTLAVVGTALGAYVKSYELVSVITGSLIFTFALLAPTFMPVEILPLPLQWLGWLFPTTYISGALTKGFLGVYDLTFYLHLTILVGMLALAIFVTLRFLAWQID
jgi:ABC-2 type transport system permease protein